MIVVCCLADSSHFVVRDYVKSRYQFLLYIGLYKVETVHPGLFTLVGAAAGLGGMARMTISLAVIILELTGVVNWGPPIMISLLAARWTGNSFNEGKCNEGRPNARRCYRPV